jgi:hypothetical protein
LYRYTWDPPPIDEFGLLREAWAAAEQRTRTALDEKKRDELARSAARKLTPADGGDAGDAGEAGAGDAGAGDADELWAMVEQFEDLVGAAAPGTVGLYKLNPVGPDP